MTQQQRISARLRERREQAPAQRRASSIPVRVEMWLHGVKIVDTAEQDPSDVELDARLDRALRFRLDR